MHIDMKSSRTKQNVLVISGGETSERQVSLRSSSEVVKALQLLEYQVELFDLKDGYEKLQQELTHVDIAFPKLHGKEGEDGTLYQFLKESKVPYVGSDPKGAKIAFDKVLSKKYFQKNNIPTGRWKIIKTVDDIKSFGFPCVLKAAAGGSSKEVVLLHTEEDLTSDHTKEILSLNDTFYVEELLKGIEVTVGILNGKALPVIEIRPPQGKWFDYKNKYSGESEEIIDAPSLPDDLKKKVQEIAVKLHTGLKLGPYSRTDFIVVTDQPYVLEINTPCGVGFTSQSLFPKMARAIGLEFPQLCDLLVKTASA